MVKLIGPCFSLSAEGNLGDTLNYHLRNDQFIAQAKRTCVNTKTDSLIFVNSMMRHTVWTWQHLTQNIIDLWDAWAATYRPDGSGYNFFTCYYMRDLCEGLIPPLIPT